MYNLKRLRGWVSVFGLCLVLACSGEDDENGDATRDDESSGTSEGTPSAVSGGSDGAEEAGGRPAVPPEPEQEGPRVLDDGVVGQACANDDECPSGGFCASSIDLAGVLGGFISGTMDTEAPGGYCTLGCEGDDVCGASGTCVGDLVVVGMSFVGFCQALCETDSDCRDGYRCVAGLDPTGIASGGGFNPLADAESDPPACAPIPETVELAAGIAGGECTEDADCTGGGTCQIVTEGVMGFGGVTYPGGSCTGPCLEDVDCGEGGACVPSTRDQGAGNCVSACEGDADCREGYRCRVQGGDVRGCVPGDPPVTADELGEACEPATDADPGIGCGSRCVTTRATFGAGETAFPDGYCSARCIDDGDCGGGLCLGGFNLAGITNIAGLCYKPCSEDADCDREGYVCTPYERPSFDFGGAPPPANDGMQPAICQPSDD